jgi:hypothetical protein
VSALRQRFGSVPVVSTRLILSPIQMPACAGRVQGAGAEERLFGVAGAQLWDPSRSFRMTCANTDPPLGYSAAPSASSVICWRSQGQGGAARATSRHSTAHNRAMGACRKRSSLLRDARFIRVPNAR